MVCFFLFTSFALFAVNDSKTERPQYFLVRTVPVVRGSCNSKGLSVVILTAKCAKIAKSLYGLFLLVRALRVVRGSKNLHGASVVFLTAKCSKTAKVIWSLFSCSRRSRRSRFMLLKRSFCCLSNRETHENREKFVRFVSPCSCLSCSSRFMESTECPL